MNDPVVTPPAVPASSASSARPPPLRLHAGTLEALKWLALALMVLDHVNTFLHDRAWAWAYQAGRLVAPIFAFVLAYHLAQPAVEASGAALRVMRRLALFGALASAPFMALIGRPLPLNILFTLLFGIAMVHALRQPSRAWHLAAAVVFTVGGALGEFLHFGLLMVAAAWAYCRQPDATRLLLWVGSVAMLFPVNGNLHALGAVPLLLAARWVDLRVPRVRHLFYAVYPLHLAVLWAWRHWGAGP